MPPARPLLLLLPLTLACHPEPPPPAGATERTSAPPAAPIASTPTASAATAAPPLASPRVLDVGAELLDLHVGDVHGFVAVPAHATDARPIVVGVHGAEDHADWSCSEWAATLGRFAWVVCPEGTAFRTGFVWTSAEQIHARALALVEELRRRWPTWIAPGPLVYGGWSQGASLAGIVVSSHPGTFDRAVLVEGGHTPLDGDAVVASLRRGGVTRALVSCSSTPCRTLSQAMAAAGPKRGVDVLTNDVGLRGHWFDAPVFATLGEKWPALVAPTAAWDGYLPPSRRENR